MAAEILSDLSRATDNNSSPIEGAQWLFCATGTLTPQAVYTTAALDTEHSNPVVADAAGRFPPIYFDASLSYRGILKNAAGATLSGMDIDPINAGIASALAASAGAALVGFLQSGTGAVARTADAKLKDLALSVKDFGAAGDDVADDTAAIQATFAAASASGKAVYIPAGTYKITGLTLTGDQNEFCIFGDGRRETILKLYTASTATYALDYSLGDNSSAIGFRLSNIGITCNGGAAMGRGIRFLTTATNSAFSQCELDNIRIQNCTEGVYLYGVVYMSTFRNITITGVAAAGRGWNTLGIGGQVIYNTFQDLEVTGVEAAGYAYYFDISASRFKNLTADACIYVNGAYNSIDGMVIEGIHAATPASTNAMEFNQISSAENLAVIQTPNTKCTVAVAIQGPNFRLSGLRIPDAGAGNQPNRALMLYTGNKGSIDNVHCDLAITDKLEVYLSDAILNNFVFTGCDAVTDRAISYEEGTWTPTFTGWSAPSSATGRYVRTGNLVTLFISGVGGVAPASGDIGGLPFAASAAAGGNAMLSSSTPSRNFIGRIYPGNSVIDSLPSAVTDFDTPTQYWTLTATYRAA